MARGRFGGGSGTVNVTTNADATARADAALAKATADANKAKIDALVPPGGATIAAGSTTNFVVNGAIGPWTNAATATVPATTTDANLRTAGFLPFSGASTGNSQFYFATRANNSTVAPTAVEAPTSAFGDTCDIKLANGSTLKYRHDGTAWVLLRTDAVSGAGGNQRVFVIVRTGLSTAAPTQAEINTANGGTAYTLQAGDTVKVSNSRRAVVWYTHNGTSWDGGRAEPDTPNQRTFHIIRNIETTTAPSQAEIDGVNGGAYILRQYDIAEVYTPTRTVVFEHDGTSWDAGFQRLGGAPSENTVLASLPADTWTNVPTSTVIPDPHNVTAQDQFGNNIDIPIRRNAGAWQAQSSVTMPNVQFTLWR